MSFRLQTPQVRWPSAVGGAISHAFTKFTSHLPCQRLAHIRIHLDWALQQLPCEVAESSTASRGRSVARFLQNRAACVYHLPPATLISSADSRRGGDQHEAAGAVPGHLLSRPCSILSLVAAPPHTAATFFADNPARRTLCLQEASKAFAARVCNFARSRNGHFFDVTSTVTYMVTRYITRCILFNEG